MRRRLVAVAFAVAVLAAAASPALTSNIASSKPDPTSMSSCNQWITVFEAHWSTLPQCHSGTPATACCELYDLMDNSIRIFNNKLGCHFYDINVFSTKFSLHCPSTGRVRSSDPLHNVATHSHGTTPIDVLNAGILNPTEHTTGNCINCGGGGGGCTTGNCGYPPAVPGCQTGHCGQPAPQPPACSSGNCGGGCQTGHCGGGCGSGGCQPVKQPVATCVGARCGCTKCCVDVTCHQVYGTSSGTGASPNQGTGTVVLPPDDDNDVCFHGDGVVSLQDGGAKRMRDLIIGDVVHVGGGQFSEVFMFTHQDANKPSTYVNMTVGSGEWVMVTPTHYMYSSKGMQLAAELNEGDDMEMEDGRMEQVVSKTVIQGRGLYNPQTIHGDVAVSGFRASTYTKTIEYETAHSLLAPLRAMYRICGAHISAMF